MDDKLDKFISWIQVQIQQTDMSNDKPDSPPYLLSNVWHWKQKTFDLYKNSLGFEFEFAEKIEALHRKIMQSNLKALIFQKHNILQWDVEYPHIGTHRVSF